MTKDKATAAFLTSGQAKHLRPKTLEAYRWALSYLPPGDLPADPYEIELLLAETSHLNPTSQYDLWRRLRTIFRFLSRRYEVPNPFERVNLYDGSVTLIVEPPVQPPRLPKVLNRQQVDRLLALGPRSTRDRILLLLPLDTGLRLGEIASLTKGDLAADRLRVRGKRGEREVPVSQDLVHHLLIIGTPTHPWTSHDNNTPLSFDGVKQCYDRMFTRAQIKAGPHALRHTFATNFIRNGGGLYQLQRILGHRDVATTQIYLHLVSDDLVADHHRASPARDWIAGQQRLFQ